MKLAPLAAIIAALALATSAHAAGELGIYNWRNYTSPALIEKFEAAHDVEVTVTEYDSEAAALDRIRAGEHGFDIVVPSARVVRTYIAEGLALRTRPDRMENFQYVAQAWADPGWDPGRRYSVPWQWGGLGIVVDGEAWQGAIDSAALIFEPPEALAGRISVAPDMEEVIGTALLYLGAEPCTADREVLERLRELLLAARRQWLSIDYGLSARMPQGEIAAALHWAGAAFRARQARPSIRFAYPREGFPVWMDSVIVLRDAKNVENARLFQNFVMQPENAALISAFAGHANAIEGSEAYLPEALRAAPEINAPAEAAGRAVFLPECPPEVTALYTAIWRELRN